MGNNSFAPFQKLATSFIVRNIITDSNKTVRIFQYPIPVGQERDLLEIPGIAEADIRASLLKGELLVKLMANEIEVVFSDINLLQFNFDQRSFLESNGITLGTRVSKDNRLYYEYRDVELLGVVNDANTVFTVAAGNFIQNGPYNIVVYKNGVKQLYLDDYSVAESGGPGTGYDTVIFSSPPSTTPPPSDVITADYYIFMD